MAFLMSQNIDVSEEQIDNHLTGLVGHSSIVCGTAKILTNLVHYTNDVIVLWKSLSMVSSSHSSKPDHANLISVSYVSL